MITKKELKKAQDRTIKYLDRAGIVLTQNEKENIEVVDFGLGDFENIGLELVVYINTDRYCGKELVLFPWQICAEHRHPPVDERNPGKEETFRCRWGEVYLYVPGDETKNAHSRIPKGKEKYLTVRREIALRPGDQYTLSPDTLHWFQAGAKGAIVSEFSSTSIDEKDVFTDPGIKRTTKIAD